MFQFKFKFKFKQSFKFQVYILESYSLKEKGLRLQA